MRPEKANIVSDLSAKLKASLFVLVTDYQRMKVDQFSELRNRLAPAGAEIHVIKNSFLKRAIADSGLPDVADTLTGQTAIVTGEKDVAPVAKILKAFAAEFKIATLKIGIVDRSILPKKDVETLADLPAREVLQAQLLGLLLAPATRLVRVLNEPGSAFARLLNARASKMPAAEPSKPEESAPEAKEVPVESAPAQESPVAGAKTETPAAEAMEVPVEPAPAQESPVAEAKTETPVAEPKKEEPLAPETSA
jgi:large subunit ribosomal protein L10